VWAANFVIGPWPKFDWSQLKNGLQVADSNAHHVLGTLSEPPTGVHERGRHAELPRALHRASTAAACPYACSKWRSTRATILSPPSPPHSFHSPLRAPHLALPVPERRAAMGSTNRAPPTTFFASEPPRHQLSMKSPFPACAAPSEPFPRSEPPSELVTAMAVHRAPSRRRRRSTSSLPPPELTTPLRSLYHAAPPELLASPFSPPPWTAAGASAGKPSAAVAAPPRATSPQAVTVFG
jgi:hypothetical protein